MCRSVGIIPNISVLAMLRPNACARIPIFRVWVFSILQIRLWTRTWLTLVQAVLQCLYSQCQTTHFGSALHFALSQCAEYGLGTTDILPPLIRHQGLRKRAYPDLKDLSVHAIASATHSVARRLASISAVPYPKPTRSAAYPAANTYANPHSLPTTLITAVLSASGNGTVPQAL